MQKVEAQNLYPNRGSDGDLVPHAVFRGWILLNLGVSVCGECQAARPRAGIEVPLEDGFSPHSALWSSLAYERGHWYFL